MFTAAILTGCGVTSPKTPTATPPSTTSPAPVTVTHTVPVTHTVTVTHTVQAPAPDSTSGLNPNAPTNLTTPVPITIHGMSDAQAGMSTITVSYDLNAYYQWDLFSLTLWVFNNPQSSFTSNYWNVGSNGTYTFPLPMSLGDTSVRIIAQFIGPRGNLHTEYGPPFTVQ